MPLQAQRASGTVEIFFRQVGMQRLSGYVNAEFKKMSGRQSYYVGMMTSRMGYAMLGMSASIVAFAALSVREFAKFDQAMQNTASVTNATADAMVELTEIALELGTKGSASAREVADGMYALGSAGYEVKEILETIEPVMHLAVATQTNMTEVSRTLMQTLKAFGKEAKDAGHFAEVFAAGISSSQLRMESLTGAFKHLGPVAKEVGMSIEEAVAVLALLADVGIPGPMAGRHFRRIIQGTIAETPKAVKVLKDLGLEYDDLNIKLHGVEKVFTTLSESGADLGDIFALFGLRASASGAALKRVIPDFDEYLENVSDGEALMQMFNIQMKGLDAQFKKFKNTLVVFMIRAVAPFIPAIRRIVESLTEFFDMLSRAPKWVHALIGIGAIVAALALAFLGLNFVLVGLLTQGTFTFRLLSQAIHTTYVMSKRTMRGIFGIKTSINATTVATMSLTKAFALLGIAAGSAFAGWGLGRIIADLTGTDEMITSFYDKHFFGTSEKEYAAYVRDYADAIKLLEEEFGKASKVIIEFRHAVVSGSEVLVAYGKVAKDARIEIEKLARAEAVAGEALFAKNLADWEKVKEGLLEFKAEKPEEKLKVLEEYYAKVRWLAGSNNEFAKLIDEKYAKEKNELLDTINADEIAHNKERLRATEEVMSAILALDKDETYKRLKELEKFVNARSELVDDTLLTTLIEATKTDITRKALKERAVLRAEDIASMKGLAQKIKAALYPIETAYQNIAELSKRLTVLVKVGFITIADKAKYLSTELANIKRAIAEVNYEFEGFTLSLQRNWSDSIFQLIKGTKSWLDLWNNVCDNALKSFIDGFVEGMVKSFARGLWDMQNMQAGWGSGLWGKLATWGATLLGGFGGGTTIPPVTGFAKGTDYVPKDMLAYLHQGEAVVPASENEQQQEITIVNVIDPSFVNASIAREPNTIVNIINDDVVMAGSTRKTMRRYLR